MTKDKVVELPVRFKNRTGGDMLLIHKTNYACNHGPFLIDDRLEQVECEKCGERMNAMWVLRYLATHERRWHEHRERYAEEVKRLDERSKTKCQFCKQMTRISRA